MAFKRPFHAQSRTPVRSSDLRRLRESVAAEFPLLAAEDLKRLTADLLVSKAHTHLDEPCTIYYAPNGDPRFVRLLNDPTAGLVPTCYATDVVSSSPRDWLPTLATAPQVVPNLVSGSALFAAGIAPDSIAHLVRLNHPRKGSLVGITVHGDSEHRIVAVGSLAAEPSEIRDLQRGDKGGKAVLTLHARGDFLWQSGSKVDAPRTAVSQILADDGEEREGGEDTDGLTEQLAATSLPGSTSSKKKGKGKDKKSAAVATDAEAPGPSSENAADGDDGVPTAGEEAGEAPLSPAEVDTILLNALLLALSTSPALSKPATLPLSASTLYSTYLLPSRPASPPAHATADLKKSSFKKLDRFVKAAVKKGYLTAKEVKKGSGEWIVTQVETRHPDAEKVPRYRTVAEAAASTGAGPASTAASGTGTAAAAPGPTSRGRGGAGGVEVRELWKLSGDSVKTLFRSVPHERPPHDLYTTSDLSSLLRKYTDTHRLSHPSQRSLLLLSPTAAPHPPTADQSAAIELLAKCVCRKGEVPEEVGRERGAGGLVGREEALRRVQSLGCTGYWSLRRGTGSGAAEEDAEEMVKKGSPPVVKVAIKNVGKRQVTLISGHEPWELFTSEELAEKLKHASASSTSIQALAGSAKKGQAPKVEIMSQGTHDALVTKLLTAYGVPKAYIEVDLSKSKK
ncbi:hypothetical protein JCM8202_001742 [Rhodotorula sphaerocarpa]